MCMDSRSGPEVPSKVHGFGEAVKRWRGGWGKSEKGQRAGWLLAATLLAACGPNMEQPEGVLGALAQGCASGSAEAAYPAIDERSRFALDAIVDAHNKARQLIAEQYPAEARAAAFAQLDDLGEVKRGAELFARRCPGACFSSLCEKVGAVTSAEQVADTTHVRTVRGGEYVLYRTPQGRYGIVFETEALMRERRRAFAALSAIKANAQVYARQRALH